MDIDGWIAQANGRLKAARIGVQIQALGGRLHLRATFPPKPNSSKKNPYQQRLALGYRVNPTGVKLAEQQARVVGTQLERKEFLWEPYLKVSKAKEAETCLDWITRLEEKYLHEGGTESTWKGDYLKILKRLPPDEELTADLLHQIVCATTPNTKTRKRACMAIGALAKVAKLDYDPSPYAGNYSPKRVSPRDLPSDEQIADWFYRIKNPAWRWVYGMMATYGLRNHEVFRLDLDQLRQGNPVVSVLEHTKTGSRRVWACYPEWYTAFDVQNIKLPKVNLERSNEKVGHSITEYFGDSGLPFKPYDLRHCWAIRTLEFGLPVELAAQQMGHSVQVHTETYHHWISDRHHQRAYELLMMRSDRPKAPVVT